MVTLLTSLQRTDKGTFTTDLDKAEVAATAITRYLNGDDATAIADHYSITRQRLYQVMSETDPEGWRQAQAARALAEFDRTYEAMRDASDPLSLARAREMHKSAQWVMERLLRKLYGDTKQDDKSISITVNVQRQDDVPSVQIIDQE